LSLFVFPLCEGFAFFAFACFGLVPGLGFGPEGPCMGKRFEF
jgi:hypothetical protein